MRLFLRVLASYPMWRILWIHLSWLIFTSLLTAPLVLLCSWCDKETFLSGLLALFTVVWACSLILLWGMMTLLYENKDTCTAWVFVRDVCALVKDDYQERKEAIIASDLKNKED